MNNGLVAAWSIVASAISSVSIVSHGLFTGRVSGVLRGMFVLEAGIVVILHPLVSVHELVLVVIESVVVLVGLNSAVLPVISIVLMIISESGISVMVITVISLVVVGAGVGMEIRNVVVLVNDVSIRVSVVVGPLLLVSVTAVTVVSTISVLGVVVVTVAMVIDMLNGSEVAVVVSRLVSMVLRQISLLMIIEPSATVTWNGVGERMLVIRINLGISVDGGMGISEGDGVGNSVLQVGILLLVSSDLVGNGVSGMVVITVVRTNIGVVVVIVMDLSAVVVRLHVHVVVNSVSLNLVHDGVVVVVSIGQVTVHSRVLVVEINAWVVHGSLVVIGRVAVVVEGIIVNLRSIVVGVVVDVVTVVGLDVSSLVAGAAEVAMISLVVTGIPVMLGSGDTDDGESNERSWHCE